MQPQKFISVRRRSVAMPRLNDETHPSPQHNPHRSRPNNHHHRNKHQYNNTLDKYIITPTTILNRATKLKEL
jgi:ABC-type transporter lipoprotein component MlaA